MAAIVRKGIEPARNFEQNFAAFECFILGPFQPDPISNEAREGRLLDAQTLV